ncbi:MAG: hypothetical protein Q6L68_06110 [Thermostichus sp. DG02_5_bins_236]
MQDIEDTKDSQAASQSPSAAWIKLALGLTTAPVLLSLVLADQARKWLGSLTWEDPGWWLGDRLPNLDKATLQARLHPQGPNDNSAPPDPHAP